MSDDNDKDFVPTIPKYFIHSISYEDFKGFLLLILLIGAVVVFFKLRPEKCPKVHEGIGRFMSIECYDNGNPKEGILRYGTIIQGFHFSDFIRFYENGKVAEGDIFTSHPIKIDMCGSWVTVTLIGKISFYPNGNVSFGRLASKTKLCNYTLKAGQTVKFHESGKLASGWDTDGLLQTFDESGTHVATYEAYSVP